MVTIVRYSIDPPVNAYPTAIVSPPAPGPCCPAHSQPLGPSAEDAGRAWPFHYRRCSVCGFTVRRFLSREELPPDAVPSPHRGTRRRQERTGGPRRTRRPGE